MTIGTKACGMTGIAVLVALAGQAAAWGVNDAGTPSSAAGIRWKSRSASPLFDRAETLKALSGVTGEHVVVQLTGPVSDAMRTGLRKQGLELQAPLGSDAYFATVAANANPAGLLRSGAFLGAAAVRPEWKLHPVLLKGETPDHTIVKAGPDPEVAVYVMLHTDVPVQAAANAVVGRRGGVSVTELVTVNAAVVHIPRSMIGLLAQEDEVQWIEPALPMMTELNSENRALTGVNTVQAAPYSLNGSGVKVLVFDGGGVTNVHQDLTGRVTIIDGSGVASHASHCAGTIGGNGTANINNRGMAPGVTFLSAALSTAMSGWLYTNPADIEADYTNAYNQGAHLASNSIGTNTAPNNFDCRWEGDYGVTDGVIDNIVRGSAVTQGNPFRIVWAAGNERGSARCGSFYHTTAPPSGSKNHLCIGSVDSNSDTSSSFSSWGPHDDGRMKPDFVAPGCQVGGDGGVTSCGTTATGYAVMCGTSMATPTVAGIVSLMLQDYRVQFPATPDPRNSTIKALLAQSAVDIGNAGPDYVYGYGSVRAPAAIDLMRTGNFNQGSVTQGNGVSFNVVVPGGAGELALTLSWDDPAATPNVIPSLVNDLDLEVYSPAGVRAFPWTLDSNNPLALAVKTQRNSLDNLEQVRVTSPQAGTWKVRVKGFNVPTGPQTFSVVSSHALSSTAAFPTIAVQTITAPTLVAPNVATPITAAVTLNNDTLVTNSVVLHYRNGVGVYTDVVMSPSGGNWTANLAGFPCGAAPQYYITAQGTAAGVASAPLGGSGSPINAVVGTQTIYFQDDMEVANPAWTVATTATTGAWARGNPERTGAQPENDTTAGAGVNCWVTGLAAGNAPSYSMTNLDVDGGNTVLTSPTFSMLGAPSSATISFMRWFETNSITTYGQPFLAEVSTNNGTSWSVLESLPTGSVVQLGWRQVSKSLATLGITGTAQMKIRFTATDTGTGIVEAAIDDVMISSVSCVTPPPSCYADCDSVGGLTANDFQCFLDKFVAGASYADCDGVGGLTANDFQCFLNKFVAGCS